MLLKEKLLEACLVMKLRRSTQILNLTSTQFKGPLEVEKLWVASDDHIIIYDHIIIFTFNFINY